MLSQINIYFKNVLIFKWKSENVLGRGYASVYMENKKLWFSLKLIKTRFDWGRPIENLGYRYKEVKKDYRTAGIYVFSLLWEQSWDYMRHDKSL